MFMLLFRHCCVASFVCWMFLFHLSLCLFVMFVFSFCFWLFCLEGHIVVMPSTSKEKLDEFFEDYINQKKGSPIWGHFKKEKKWIKTSSNLVFFFRLLWLPNQLHIRIYSLLVISGCCGYLMFCLNKNVGLNFFFPSHACRVTRVSVYSPKGLLRHPCACALPVYRRFTHMLQIRSEKH